MPAVVRGNGGLLRLAVVAATVFLLPLAGGAAAGKPLAVYLQFPPRTPDAPHAPFSLPVFLGFALVILASTAPFFRRLLSFPAKGRPREPARPFPWWGWAGAGVGATAWILAWGRFPWLGAFQAHTFTPLWVAFILVINAVTFRRSGRCLLAEKTRGFLLLFPVSAAFWWSFEYLNRFVGNWRYVGGAEFGTAEYLLFCTLPFSTVLPAVLSARELLLSFPRIEDAFRRWRPIRPKHPRAAAGATLILSCVGLIAVGIVPEIAFPLVWAAPPLLMISIAALRRDPHALSGIACGDWRTFAVSALAALACGFFWEMWNYGSLVKWVYAIPYVDVFHVFEMPILGYAGYLPFGVLCAEVGDRLLGGTGAGGKRFSPDVQLR